MTKNKKILMIALDFPPCKSAGVQRTLKFAEYLSEFGWEPIILTVKEEAHGQVDNSQQIPDSIQHVFRSFSFNAARDFSIKGKYLSILKEPDRWWTWKYTAVPLGKKIINTLKPDVIWSTYPISTAHNIAYELQRWSKLPWVADYRDPVQSRYDKSVDRLINLAHVSENKTINNANKIVFTTKKAAQLYQYLYPNLRISKFAVIENGYDEGNFAKLAKHRTANAKTNNNKFTLLHSGAVYNNGRDPERLLQVISLLYKQGIINPTNFTLVFRGADGEKYRKVIDKLNVAELIQFKPSIDYISSLEEMMNADALLIIQSELFVNQVPGKLFEYIRSSKPILAFTSSNGATAEILSTVKNSYLGDSVEELTEAVKAVLNSSFEVREDYERFSRYEKTIQLANLLDSISI